MIFVGVSSVGIKRVVFNIEVFGVPGRLRSLLFSVTVVVLQWTPGPTGCFLQPFQYSYHINPKY